MSQVVEENCTLPLRDLPEQTLTGPFVVPLAFLPVATRLAKENRTIVYM